MKQEILARKSSPNVFTALEGEGYIKMVSEERKAELLRHARAEAALDQPEYLKLNQDALSDDLSVFSYYLIEKCKVDLSQLRKERDIASMQRLEKETQRIFASKLKEEEAKEEIGEANFKTANKFLDMTANNQPTKLTGRYKEQVFNKYNEKVDEIDVAITDIIDLRGRLSGFPDCRVDLRGFLKELERNYNNESYQCFVSGEKHHYKPLSLHFKFNPLPQEET